MASGYDLSSNVPYRLMKGRLGVYDKRPFDPSGAYNERAAYNERVKDLMLIIKNFNL